MSSIRPQISAKLKMILSYSSEEAMRLGSNSLGVEHILLGILRDSQNIVIDILSSYYEINPYDIKKKIEEWLASQQDVKSSTNISHPQTLTQQTDRTLKLMYLESLQLKKEEVEPEHAVLAILKEANSGAAKTLGEFGITYENFRNAMHKNDPDEKEFDIDSDMLISLDSEANSDTSNGILDDGDDNTYEVGYHDHTETVKGSIEDVGMHEYGNIKNENPADTTARQPNRNSKSILSNFGKDLTEAAAQGKLDPIIGREKETDRIAQILSRRKKNNPILIGEPGVGKSAIAEGLAIKITERKVPSVLLDKRIISLDLASIVAGTKYRGQFEERMKTILNELEKHPEIIIFIDEIHTLVGAGETAGALDASNMLKPALARGDIQCIGATTLDEYRRSIEKDGALERRFQKVIVEPTSPAETIEILNHIKSKYEDHHSVLYTDAAIKACVDYTTRYITDRFLPDKAIDALDEAGAKVHIRNVSVPPKLVELETVIRAQQKELKKYIKQQVFDKAAVLRTEMDGLIKELQTTKQEWIDSVKKNKISVEEEDIAEVVSMISGIPLQKVEQSEIVKLLTMESALSQQIVGQDEALGKIVHAIRRNRIGLKDPNKPIGSFIFLGPTGVGKTYLTKILAKYMFDSEASLIRIDMSEYMEKFAVSRLIGAPPGYVGYEDGGQLTEKVRRKPYSIILFDEIEKAHPDIFNLLLQVLDEGTLTDGIGRKIDFKNTILIMTSNLGSRQIKEFGQGVGFYTASREAEKGSFAQNVIDKALRKQFAPEFLNRIDEVVVFHNLTKENILKIVEIEVSHLQKRIVQMGYTISLSDKAKDFILEKGWDPDLGARPLQRAIQKYIEDSLAEEIIKNKLKPGQSILVDYNKKDDKIIIK